MQLLNFPSQNVLLRKSDKVSLGIGSFHPTELSVVASVVHRSMECEWQPMLNFASHHQVLPCVCMHTSLRILIFLEL